MKNKVEYTESGSMMANKTRGIIRDAREAAGLTQKQLGTAIGLPEKSAQVRVAHWETGVRPMPRALIRKVADVLKIDPVTLI